MKRRYFKGLRIITMQICQQGERGEEFSQIHPKGYVPLRISHVTCLPPEEEAQVQENMKQMGKEATFLKPSMVGDLSLTQHNVVINSVATSITHRRPTALTGVHSCGKRRVGFISTHDIEGEELLFNYGVRGEAWMSACSPKVSPVKTHTKYSFETYRKRQYCPVEGYAA